jgi:hypothetical protein|tara:strand:+ start:172 stop:345 length:174 start_codon:yes stop_codon:yes gene_type:complete
MVTVLVSVAFANGPIVKVVDIPLSSVIPVWAGRLVIRLDLIVTITCILAMDTVLKRV